MEKENATPLVDLSCLMMNQTRRFYESTRKNKQDFTIRTSFLFWCSKGWSHLSWSVQTKARLEQTGNCTGHSKLPSYPGDGYTCEPRQSGGTTHHPVGTPSSLSSLLHTSKWRPVPALTRTFALGSHLCYTTAATTRRALQRSKQRWCWPCIPVVARASSWCRQLATSTIFCSPTLGPSSHQCWQRGSLQSRATASCVHTGVAAPCTALNCQRGRLS